MSRKRGGVAAESREEVVDRRDEEGEEELKGRKN